MSGHTLVPAQVGGDNHLIHGKRLDVNGHSFPQAWHPQLAAILSAAEAPNVKVLKSIKAGSFSILDLANVYTDAGFDVEWYGGEDNWDTRERYLQDAMKGRDWIGEDDEPIFSLMLDSQLEDHTICFAHPQSGWMHLRLWFSESVRMGTRPAAIYKYVNRVNRTYKLLRAYYDGVEDVVFEYWMILTFGVNTSTLIDSTKFFMSVGNWSVKELDRDKILGYGPA